MGKGILEDANNNNQSRKYMKFAKNEEQQPITRLNIAN